MNTEKKFQAMNSTRSNFNNSPKKDQEQEDKQQLIDDDLVFKCAMTRDLKNVQELAIVSEGLSFIDHGNMVLKQLVNLRKLDLSFNKLYRIDNLEALVSLKELNLSYNQIDRIENLAKIPGLRILNLDHNKIR